MATRSLFAAAGSLLVVLGWRGWHATGCGSETAPETPEAGAPSFNDGGSLLTDGGVGLVGSGKDTDGDGVPDDLEGSGDDDGDGIPNLSDPINDGAPPAIKLVSISTNFNTPIGIDYHEPTNSVVLSVNYTNGTPVGFERIEFDGTHHAFSTLSGLTEEVKIATARSGNPGGFTVGDLFVGNGIDGQIVRISGDGSKVTNPWVDLPGPSNGLMRGSFYVDRTGVFNGDLIAVTTLGEVWRVNAAGVPTKVAAFPNTHLEGLVVVPDKPARFGPLAGKILVGAEEAHVMYAVAKDGSSTTYTLGVDIEDIDINVPNENFFGVDFGNSRILGADPTQWRGMQGDVVMAVEHITAGTSGLVRLKWDGANVVAQPIPLAPDSAAAGQWEHVTFSAGGISEIPPVR